MGGKVQHILGQLSLLLMIADDHMGAGDILGVEPHIIVAGQPCGDIVVLHIVFAHQDLNVTVMQHQRLE